MAIFVIEGVPGSGKTYYAVWMLLLRYFKRIPTYTKLQTLFFFLRPKEKPAYVLDKDCVLITNIDQLQLAHVDLKAEIAQAGDLARAAILSDVTITSKQRDTKLDKLDPVAEFFSFDYQEEYRHRYDDKPIVYLVDEAQRFFRKGMDRVLRERGVFDYFEYHRHWGHDIFLVTQNVKKLPPDIVYLPEYIISAVPRSRSIGFGFKYRWVSSGEVINTETLRADKEVFAVYQSMEAEETEKISNPLVRKIIFTGLASVFIMYFGISYLVGRLWYPDSASPAEVVQPVDSSPARVHNSFIPIGSARSSLPPPPRYVVFIPLSKITRYANNDEKSLYVWRGHLIPPANFPHKTVYFSGQRYAVLDYELFEFMFSNEEDRPKDFIVQVAKPVPDESG
jgi:zona occludens toxin (predicted ATPase)